MPKENKKRGRREEKKKQKRKRDETTGTPADEDEAPRPKRARSDNGTDAAMAEEGHLQDDQYAGLQDQPFYGMLNDEEQEYFRRADEMLELNQFAAAEERHLFLANVYREADGKELKLACSQSCSRLLERLILLSTPAQLKTLFGKFNGHFLHLVQHRFASHCCEALFLQSAPVVTQEMTAPVEPQQHGSADEVYVSMENLFLYTLNDLEGNLGYLVTDQHASHVLRVLLVVLSGLPLDQTSTTLLLQSKKKEKVRVSGLPAKAEALGLTRRTVPEAFHAAVDKFLADAASNMDGTNVRLLATHPRGNPVLQLILELELSRSGRGRPKDGESVLAKLMSQDQQAGDVEDTSFIRGLVYDPIGSRLVETIVVHSPGKTFKALYRSFFKDKLGSLARNETAGYVVAKVLERLSREDLEDATRSIMPQIPSLVERSRTSIIRTMVERSVARGADTQPLADAIANAYGQDGPPRLLKMLRWDDTGPTSGGHEKPRHDAERLHASLLAQSMLAAPGALSGLLYDGLLATPAETVAAMAREPASSHVLQAALSLPTSTANFRRKLINTLLGQVGELAVHPAGSHVVDAMWTGSRGLGNYAQRIAEELLAREAELRESHLGRAVWRNWKMDLYVNRRSEWMAEARGGGEASAAGKTGIELARETFAARRATAAAAERRGFRGDGRTRGGANRRTRMTAA
ncbi:MAG: Nucleolar protein 9 [Thelocarpon impressellum]|nr:MAG: Nucleolar protein 9 [Thelocarpon impressellum]